jgi:hypothetical protein
MKEYHRKLTTLLSAGASKIEIAAKVKDLIAESQKSDVHQEIGKIGEESLKDEISKIGGDVGTNVHEELLN